MWDLKVKTIAALDRGLAVLDEVRRTGARQPAGAACSETGLPKATLLRILVTLERRALIWRRIADGQLLPRQSAGGKPAAIRHDRPAGAVCGPGARPASGRDPVALGSRDPARQRHGAM
ncbi:helix-turn-helix domain-containing protein [Cupriavidus basilensis]